MDAESNAAGKACGRIRPLAAGLFALCLAGCRGQPAPAVPFHMARGGGSQEPPPLLLCKGDAKRNSVNAGCSFGQKKNLRCATCCPPQVWRSGWDSNPRAREDYLISSFIKCVLGSVSFVSVSASFVLGEKSHKYWLFHVKTPRKPVVSGKFE